MNRSSSLAFTYTFRAPGRALEGPIRFAIGRAASGMVLVGRSRQGICAILLGTDASSLCSQLAAAFPRVVQQPDPQGLQQALDQIIGFIDRTPAEGELILDVGGTAFEQKVWQALGDIPAGQTRSYAEVARAIGAADAARAVAGACAANVLAVAIPCHRVIRADGAISGYRWGIERKRALLAEEAAA